MPGPTFYRRMYGEHSPDESRVSEERIREWDRHVATLERHAGCEDEPCAGCHRDAGGRFCEWCNEHLPLGSEAIYCSAACRDEAEYEPQPGVDVDFEYEWARDREGR